MSISIADMARTLEKFRDGVENHDRVNPDHNAWGIGLSFFDLERLGFEDGETLWPGVVVEVDGKCSGNFRVLCDGGHRPDEEAEAVEARGREVHA